jgi:hypothetical protein
VLIVWIQAIFKRPQWHRMISMRLTLCLITPAFKPGWRFFLPLRAGAARALWYSDQIDDCSMRID